MSLIASFGTTRAEYKIVDTPPPDVYPKWGIVNLDYDQVWDEDFNFAHHVSRPKRNDPGITVEKGLPQVARFTLDTRVKFTEDLQYWIHGLCSERIPSKPEAFINAAFASLWRAAGFMTNDKGIEGRRDYINRTNLNSEYAMIQPMGCGGALLKIVDETPRDWIFEAINPFEDYWQFHPNNPEHRHLFFEPNNSRRQKIKDIFGLTVGWDESISIPFGQYDNKAVVPILGDGNTSRNRIQKWRVRILHPGEPVPSPYLNGSGYVYPNPYAGMTG